MDSYTNRRSDSISLQKEEIVSEADLPEILSSLENEALTYITDRNYPLALTHLKRIEEIIESVTTQGGTTDPDMVLSTIHNLAVCYQNLNDLEISVKYIDACIYNAELPRTKRGKPPKSGDSIRRCRYLSSISLVYSLILKETGRMTEAGKKAKSAYTYAVRSIKQTCVCIKNILQKHNRTRHLKSRTVTKIQLIERAYPTILAIEGFLKKTGSLSLHSQMRSALGVRGHPDWVYHLSLSEMLKLNPYSIEYFRTGAELQAEFTKDYILYKIALLAVSLYAQASTCTLHSKARKLLRKADTLLRVFFPEECPLLIEMRENGKRIGLAEIPEFCRDKSLRRRPNSVMGTSKKLIRRPSSALSLKRGTPNAKMSVRRHPSANNQSFDLRRKPRNSDLRGDKRLIVD